VPRKQGFYDTLTTSLNNRQPVIIPDIKARSPEHGDLLTGRSPLDYARMMVQAGAPVLSVVTEREHYGGSLDMLRAIRRELAVPLLRKDLIDSPAQLQETKAAGAGAVLLIAAIMCSDTLVKLYNEARTLGLEPLIEAHTKAELNLALSLSPPLLGINNRDILQFEVDGGDVSNTRALATMLPLGETCLISESGLKTENDVSRAIRAGSGAVLIGTALLKADEPAALYRRLAKAAATALKTSMAPHPGTTGATTQHHE